MRDERVAHIIRYAGSHWIAWIFVLTNFAMTAVSVPKCYGHPATFEEASAHFEAGRLEEAADAFQQLLAQDPDNSEAAYNLGLCLLNMGQADSAAVVLDHVASSQKLSPVLRRDVLYNLGLAKAYAAQARATMQPGQAKELYVKAIENFRDALAYSDGEARFRTDTGYNIEAAGRLLEQLEQQMQQQGSPSASDSLAEQVQDLAQDQEQLRDQTQESKEPEELADQQQQLSERASQLAEEMQKRGMDEPAENMNDAQQQEQAAEQLKEQDTQSATAHQDEAMEELREALAQLLQQAQEGEETEEKQAPTDAREAAEELARLRHEAEKEKEKREEDLRRRGYRPPVTERVEVEKNW
jgi:hypothetical protein